ncbi:hypothetical protein Clacol_010254 [Clathrus columnatus]|uniref:sterol 3beta-glucosyltransferase n=1 Tax=Clathrus columnatus TaxID=1419009 RepID=A0AAV5AND6_9AGAM|nr:hypothetical protein Clacol_010254 [Clathrus columnatus]
MLTRDFASILQVDISTLSRGGSTFDDIPLGSPLLPIVPPLEENITLTRTESLETNMNLDSDGDIDSSQQTSEDTRFQFALLKGNETWLRFNHLIEVAREKRISASEASTSGTLIDSPVTVDFGTLTFVESRVPIFETDNQLDRKAIITHSREREVRRLFGLPNELDIWYLRSVSASHTWKYGFALTIRVVGHANLVFDFSKSDVRDEALRRLQALIPVNLPLRMSSTGKETKRSSSLLSISSPTTTSPDSSIVIKRTTSPKPTALLSPMSRTVSKLRARSFPPALIPHLAKPINLPADIPPFGISPRHFVMLTIGSRGDIQPYIALGKGLVELGHRVTLVTHEEYKLWIEGNGLKHRPIAGDPGALMKLNVDHKMFSPGFFRESLTNFRGWIDELLTLAWEHCKDADVLIESPSAMAGVHIAEALKIPYFRAFTMPWSKTSQFPHPFISPPLSNNAKFNLASYVLFDNVFWMGTSSQINRWRKKRLGLPPTDMVRPQLPHKRLERLNWAPLSLLFLSRLNGVTKLLFLDNNPDLDWTPSKELLDFIERARTNNKPLVYIGFGSITVPSPSEITKNIVKAVLKSDVRAILSKGWSSRMQKVTEDDVEIPSEILVIDKAPHDWLFAQMSAVVHHGGAGTTGASLRAGIPTIIKPWFGDQFFWASRVQRLGVGLRLSNIRSGELAEALKKATTDVFIPDLISTVNILGPLLKQSDAFFLIQNGIGVESGLRAAISTEATVISACAWVDATAIGDGALITHGRLDRLVIGIHRPSEDQSPSLEAQNALTTLGKLLEKGGCDVVLAEDIRSARWEKNLWYGA